MKIPYNPYLKQLSRNLRNNSTLSEILLWNELKGSKLNGYQFMRQKPIGNYIVDFYCSRLKLVIEIDGDSHSDKEEQDQARDAYLVGLGLSVTRIGDLEVKIGMSQVLDGLMGWMEEFEMQEGKRTTP